MKLGVVAALKTELKPTLAALNAPPLQRIDFSDACEAPPFVFVIGGVGREAAGEATTLAASPPCQGVLSVGFCGALDDSLAPGDIILGGVEGFEPSSDLLERAKRAGPHRLGTIHTADRVINDPEEKRRLAATGAMAVDMEAAGVAEEARNLKRPYLCVKVVLDTPSQPLASTYASFGRLMLDVLKRPWIVGRMIGDGKRAKLAAEKLRDFFVAFAKEINPSAT